MRKRLVWVYEHMTVNRQVWHTQKSRVRGNYRYNTLIPSVRQCFVGKTDSFNEHCAAAEEKEGEEV